MRNKKVQDFLLGILIAFTISTIILAVVMAFFSDDRTVPVSFLWQAFVLSTLCSLINLIYRSERIKFVWQSITGYILTVAAITSCGLVFGWYSYGGNTFDRTTFVLASILIFSLFYLFTWLIIWKTMISRKKLMNDKLNEFKRKL